MMGFFDGEGSDKNRGVTMVVFLMRKKAVTMGL